MSHINKTDFFDEYDNLFKIQEVVKKERYAKPFKFLFQFFFNHHNPRITTREFREPLGIYDLSTAHQILESFRILNLLNKTQKNNRVFYSPINKDMWDIGMKATKTKKPPEPPKKKKK